MLNSTSFHDLKELCHIINQVLLSRSVIQAVLNIVMLVFDCCFANNFISCFRQDFLGDVHEQFVFTGSSIKFSMKSLSHLKSTRSLHLEENTIYKKVI